MSRLKSVNNRSLTNPKLRDQLWLYAGGKCQICGCDLDETWEADHIVPWKESRRTNVFEMQALCQKCNRSKGASVNFTYDQTQLRPGQKSAIQTIASRIHAREKHTAIILPTRYGKSDVIRLSAIELKEAGMIGSSLVFSPNVYLRDQIANSKKIMDMVKRYRMDELFGKAIHINHPNKPTLQKLHGTKYHIISLTTQILHSRLSIFEDYVDHVVNKTGKPVLVFVDECHTNTEDNSWGKNANRLVDHGALLVMLTATATRADNEKIVGFDYDLLNHEDSFMVKGKRLDEKRIQLDTYVGSKTIWQIRAHHETKFSKAWDEDPLPLCRITKQMFDVEVDEFQKGSRTGEKRWLSDFSEKEARSNLGRICEHPVVINEGAKRIVFELRNMQKITPTLSGVVFCSNDKATELEVNKHAKEIKQAILRHDKTLEVLIATSADKEDGRKVISSFVEEEKGDILIVKQMAGVGVDCPRLKIALDLSPVRAPSSYTQRIMRIATPFGEHLCGLLIAPDEITGQAMFQYCVTGQGGESKASEYVHLKTDIIEKPEDEKQKKEYFPINTADSNFVDNNLLTGQPHMQIFVKQQKEKNPRLAQIMTDPEIAMMILDIKSSNGVGVVDETELCEQYLSQLRSYANEETLKRLKLNNTPYGTKQGNSLFGNIIASVWNEWALAANQEPTKPSDKDSGKLKELLRCAIEGYNASKIKRAC